MTSPSQHIHMILYIYIKHFILNLQLLYYRPPELYESYKKHSMTVILVFDIGISEIMKFKAFLQKQVFFLNDKN